jgi:predicted transcriptional regulator
MPLLYENTDATIRYHAKKLGKTLKLSPSPSVTGYLLAFGAGMLFGPFVMDLLGVTERRIKKEVETRLGLKR